MAATAQMQWTLSEHESQATLKAWRDNLMCFLSQEEIFRPFLLPGVTWGKKTKRNPFRSFTGSDAASKTTILELILLRIAVFAPVLSRHTIVKNSTSLNCIWDSLCLYYGLDNFSEPNVSLAQSSHQQSCKLYSGQYQTAPVPQETAQVQQDTIEHSENAPTSFTVHLSQSALVDDRIDQLRSSNLVTETPSTVASSPQPTEEYIEIPVDPHAGSSTSATNTFSESGVELCRQEMDDMAVQREEHSPFSSHLVFDSPELDLHLHLHPVKSSPQEDHHLDQFPGNHNTTHSHEQPEISPFLLSSSVQKHEPELSVHDVEDLVTESISEETPNPIDKLSFEPASEELPRSNKTEAFEPEKEEEEQISPEWTYDRDPEEEEEEEQISLECTYDRDPDETKEEQITAECSYDRDQDKCDDLNMSPLVMTVMTKPEDQHLTEEIGRLKPADTKEMNNSFAGKIPKPKTKDFITQPELLDVLNTPIRAPLHSNATEESGIRHGLPTGNPSTATETSYTKPLAEPIIPKDHLLEQFPRDHENRVNYSLLSSSPVSSYSSKYLYHHPVKSPQQDLFPEQDVFPEPFHRDCHPSQVHQRRMSASAVSLLSTESQIYLTDARSMKRPDSAARDSDKVSNAKDELPNTVHTNKHAELQHTALTIQGNKVKQDPELTMDIAGNHATEPTADDLLRPTQKESFEPITHKPLKPVKCKECIEYLQIEDVCATKVPKLKIQRLTEKSEHFKHTNAEEQVVKPLAEELLSPEKVDAGALIPEPKEIPIEPAIVHLPETKSKLPKAIENPEPKKSTAEEPVKTLPAQVSLPEQQHKEILPKVPRPINMRLILSPKKKGHNSQFSRYKLVDPELQAILDKFDVKVIPPDSSRTWLPTGSVCPSDQTPAAQDIREIGIKDVHISHFDSDKTSTSGTSILAVSDSHDTGALDSPILFLVCLFHLRGDHIVSTPGDDIYHCETESTDTQPLLSQTHDESSSFEIIYPPYSPSVAQPRSFGQIGHISTRSSDSQPQASATEYVVLSALHQALGIG